MSDDDLKSIYTSAAKRNQIKDITRMLFHTNEQFLQILEGEEAKVRELYDTIQKDTRHKNTTIFMETEGERQFGDWSMGFKKINSESLKRVNKDSISDLNGLHDKKPGDLVDLMQSFMEM